MSAIAQEVAELELEQAAFNAQLDEMLKEHAGEFVVFKGGRAVAFFAGYDEAYRAALERFGPDETFIVSEVKRRTPEVTSIAWEAGVFSR